MFGVSYTEMMIIGLIALIIVGPEHLPEMANRIGKIIRTLNMATWDLNRQIQDAARAQLREQQEQLNANSSIEKNTTQTDCKEPSNSSEANS